MRLLSPFSPGRAVVVLAAVLCLDGLALVSAQQGGVGGRSVREGLTRADGQRMREKVAAIEARASQLVRPPARGVPSLPGPVSTLVSEREVNAYLAFEAGSQIPVGIAQPRIGILGDRRLAGTALVDLDAVREHHKPTGWLDPMRYLSGQLPLTVTGRLDSANGVGRFELESARLSGIPIPKTLLQELLTYYSRNAANPEGLNLDDPFPLPARIRQIDVARRGEAVVVQQ